MTQTNRIKGAAAAERLAAALHALSALHIVAASQTAVDMFEDDMRAAFHELAEALGYTVKPLTVVSGDVVIEGRAA